MSTEKHSAETPGPAAHEATSEGNSLIVSLVLFLVLFGLFVAGLYIMSLFTPVTFTVGTLLCILALYLSFDTVPRFLS